MWLEQGWEMAVSFNLEKYLLSQFWVFVLQQLQVIIVLMEFETLFFWGGLFDSMKYNIIYHVLKKTRKKVK